MAAYREPDGLNDLTLVLSGLQHEVRMEKFRRFVQTFVLVFFSGMFGGLVIGESFLFGLMMSILQVEVFGTIISGATLGLIVPAVIGATHVKLHYEADHFTQWWLKRLSAIGIFVFALGASAMIGFSTWQAAEDTASVVAGGTTGTLGGMQIGGGAGESGLVELLASIPNTLLFLGVSFAFVISLSFASFCLGRALQAFNILTLTPRVSPQIRARIDQLNDKIADVRALLARQAAARRKLPLDIKVKFAREAAHACYQIVQAKIAAARRKFDPMRPNNPLMEGSDPDVESIPSYFSTEEDLTRHLADQLDAVRLHNLLRVLTGINPEQGQKQ